MVVETPPSKNAFAATRANDDRARLSAALTATGAGDRGAFEDVYKKTSAKLFGICLRIFGDRQEAEDALQDAYITIWNKAATFDPARASPITWLAVLTRNRAIDRLRAKGRAVTVPVDEAFDVADDAPSAEAQLLGRADDSALHVCIDALEPRDSAFIRAAFMHGATYADLATKEALPLGTVKSRIRRALITLRTCLSGDSA
jgi:RNA polymerase sigma-70 factor, ECF subfamily